ncbi:MAG: cytochrome c3 family protein [Deltaproteobacteria bacterium]|nr:cytochrome c3 family protein [Deltaproteobacteria bacterium]
MSQSEDKVSENSAEKKQPRQPGENEQGNGSSGPILLLFIVGLVISLIIGWVIFPKLLYSQKKQPIDFNHELHNQEVDEGCISCHFFREDGSFAGVPKNEQCAGCHEEVLGESTDEAILVEEYIAKDKEIPWLIYSKQPDCVFFSHAAHVKMAEMGCKTCHGPIGKSTSLKMYEENRISGYSRDIWGKNISGINKQAVSSTVF